MRAEGMSDELPLEYHQYVEPKTQNRASPREQAEQNTGRRLSFLKE